MLNKLVKKPFLALLLLVIFLPSITVMAVPKYTGPTYSAEEIADAVKNSPYANEWLIQNAEAVANLAINVESGGRSISNGKCCHGVMQMRTANIDKYAHMTPQQYIDSNLQTQIDAWAELTSEAWKSSVPKKLAAMDTFDGRKVTGEMVLACIQLGIGNCKQMLKSGRCDGFHDSNGTTICSMAEKMGNTSNIPMTSNGSSCDAADPATFLSDTDGYGALPEASFGDYATMSPLEMILTEADRRLSSDNWQKKITQVSSRALWVDYVKVLGAENYLRKLNYDKRENIEAQLANLTSIRLENQILASKIAQDFARQNHIHQQIK